MKSDAKVLVAGAKGLVGSAITRKLQERGYSQLLLVDREEIDLTDQRQVEEFFASERPEYCFLAAARVGGIYANSHYPADFIRDNLLIQSLVIDAAYRNGVKRLLFLGSSCIYPRLAPQPMREEHLLTGPLEQTNEPYAIAKIAGIKMCQSYRRQFGMDVVCLMPTNLYGPRDNYDLQMSHVIAALIRKFHDAKVRGDETVPIWGTGKPRREFLHVDDLADAAVFLMNQPSEALDVIAPERLFNVGTGRDQTIGELALLIGSIIYPAAKLTYDPSMPDGMPQKLLDVSRMEALGWKAQIDLADGIRSAYDWFRRHHG